MKDVDASLLILREHERVERRKKTIYDRKEIIQAFYNKEISTDDLVFELFQYYTERNYKGTKAISVTSKIPPYLLVCIDYEINVTKRFLNRSDFLRKVIQDFFDRYEYPEVMQTLKSSGVLGTRHGND